ncbi:MAG: M15 family metallopeptidase [Micropepsaceae bacterium]
MSNSSALNRRQFAAAALGALSFALARAAPASEVVGCTPDGTGLAHAAQRLALAYPDFIASANLQTLAWKDGFRMPVSLYAPGRSLADQINNPDLAAQVSQAYPRGHCGIPVNPASDPGRIRYAPFFARMYGGDRASVARNLEEIPWPSRARNGFIEFSRVNGAADRLRLVAEELAQLPPHLHRFFDRPAGGFYWRPIAGTNRLSGHAYGIAVDINVNLSDYWRNELRGTAGEPENWRPTRPRNRIPFEIVDVFERQGFIWGGKWFHYDTMHFEYRPELLI